MKDDIKKLHKLTPPKLIRVCGCYLVRISCSPTSTDDIYTMQIVLREEVNDETSTIIGLRIGPPLP